MIKKLRAGCLVVLSFIPVFFASAIFEDKVSALAATLHFEELDDGPNSLYFFGRKLIKARTDD